MHTTHHTTNNTAQRTAPSTRTKPATPTTGSPDGPAAHSASETDAGIRHGRKLMKIVAKRSFCMLATTSEAGRSHAAGVVYQEVEGELWIHTMASSRKGRNVATTGQVGVGLSFRRLPAGPPFTIHYQAKAQIVPMDDPEVVELLAANKLDRVAGHGALDMADGCFIRVARPRTMHSYGPGASVIKLIRDPLNNGARSVKIPAAAGSIR